MSEARDYIDELVRLSSDGQTHHFVIYQREDGDWEMYLDGKRTE